MFIKRYKTFTYPCYMLLKANCFDLCILASFYYYKSKYFKGSFKCHYLSTFTYLCHSEYILKYSTLDDKT